MCSVGTMDSQCHFEGVGSSSTEEEENFSSSCSISLKSSGSTTGISSMDTNSDLRFVHSNATLDDYFRDRENDDDEDEDDEGNVSQSDFEDLVTDIEVTVTLKEKSQLEEETKAECNTSSLLTSGPNPMEDLNAPLKYYLRPVCTIGTGTFGRVALTRHYVTGSYYALKAMYIPSIIERRQIQHVHNEKKILQKLSHPFIVKMFDTAKDQRNLYMIMEFLAGGELFAYLRATKVFPSNFVKFYAAEVILALEYLHSLSIAFRDLKPENLMLTQEGHIKLTDFGFAKEIHNKSYTLCGTAEYLAPELANRIGHNHCVDYWALGVLIFELQSGHSPFPGDDTDDVQDLIVEMEGKVEFPRKTFSPNAKDLIIRLLNVDHTKRLGSNGVHEIKSHDWFETIDWAEMYNCKVKPPLQPTVYHEGDTGNFDSYAEEENRAPAKQRDLDLFDEW